MSDPRQGRPDQFASVREHEAAVEAVAERDVALGATAQCLRRWARDEHPLRTTVAASHFDLGVGSADFGLARPTYTGGPPDALAEYAEEFERARKAAEEDDDRETADALAVLAAWIRGEPLPSDAARRVTERL